MNVTEIPERWVVIKIKDDTDSSYKIYATWAGGYLGSDRWKFNSGISAISEDNEYYYFYGYSGSCYKCHKKRYGIITSYNKGVLTNIIDKSEDKISILDSVTELIEKFKIYKV